MKPVTSTLDPWSSKCGLLVWARPGLLERDLKHGPLSFEWFSLVLQWVHTDSELGAHIAGTCDVVWRVGRPSYHRVAMGLMNCFLNLEPICQELPYLEVWGAYDWRQKCSYNLTIRSASRVPHVIAGYM